MIFTKSIICKSLLLTLVLCCLTSVNAGKIPKTKTKSVANSTIADITTQKSVVVATEAVDENADADDDDGDDDDDDEASAEEADNAAEKNALQPAAPSALSVWGIVRGVWNWIKADLSEGLFGEDDTTSAVGEGRTFGKIRRLQMALIPIVFKFGVLTAMVAFLVAIGLKTLFFVKMLLAMNVLVLLSKFFTLKTNFGHYEHSAPSTWDWNPHMSSGWSSPVVSADPVHHPSKEIHLHIHGGHEQPQVQGYSTYNAGASQQQSQGWEARNGPYNAYGSLNLQDQNDYGSAATSAIPVTQQINANYASNHRMF